MGKGLAHCPTGLGNTGGGRAQADCGCRRSRAAEASADEASVAAGGTATGDTGGGVW